MKTKTYYFEQDGIRTEGHATKTAARNEWLIIRDEFVKRSAECAPWIFNYGDHVTIVYADPGINNWAYKIVGPDTKDGRVWATCNYRACHQVAAIVQALSALAQCMWVRGCDPAALFDGIMDAARIRPEESAVARREFLHLASRWQPVAA